MFIYTQKVKWTIVSVIDIRYSIFSNGQFFNKYSKIQITLRGAEPFRMLHLTWQELLMISNLGLGAV